MAGRDLARTRAGAAQPEGSSEGDEPVPDGPGDLADGDGELYDTEVGTDRAGRLTQEGDGHVPST
ncbi:hypothetical protein EAO68_17960, partial [Streptomyces sp. wa22]